jgi:proline dehydrogenase
MPGKSKAQRQAAGIALAVKRGEQKAVPGSPSEQMAKGMSEKQLKDFTKKPKK